MLEQLRSEIERLRSEGEIDTSGDGWRTRLPRFPDVRYEEGGTWRWVLETSEGPIEVELRPDVAPDHVTNLAYLTELGFYDGTAFHRIISRFMAQGGCPLGTGTGGPGYQFDGETDPAVRHDRPGLLSMANTGQPCSDGSQFFLTFVPTSWLDGKHTIFGAVVEGMETVEKLEAKGSASGAPTGRVTIESARIVEA